MTVDHELMCKKDVKACKEMKRINKKETVTERTQWSNRVEGRGGALAVSRKTV